MLKSLRASTPGSSCTTRTMSGSPIFGTPAMAVAPSVTVATLGFVTKVSTSVGIADVRTVESTCASLRSVKSTRTVSPPRTRTVRSRAR